MLLTTSMVEQEGAAVGSAPPDGVPAPKFDSATLQYFMVIYPLFMSFGIGGAITGAIYYLYEVVWQKVQSKLYCSIQIKDNEQIFWWINWYMKDQGYVKKETSLRGRVYRRKGRKQARKKTEMEYLAGYGNHLIKFNGQTLWVVHSAGETMVQGWDRTPKQQEWIDIYAWGNDTTNIKAFIDEAIVHQMKKDHEHIIIYELSWCNWRPVQSKKPRSIESVILDGGNAQMLMDDMKMFKASAQWYIDKGVPFRRGYMLHGPPGTGKTSFTQAIAGAMNMNVCYLNLSGNQIDDDGLNRALNQAPMNSIILLEDIDGIFKKRESVLKESKGRHVTFSGLLNALDGVRSQEGSIVFMTTNHIERLDPALLRPGRCDITVKLNNASHAQMKHMFKRFFNDCTEEEAEKFAAQLPEFKISMAKMQGHFLTYRDSSKECMAHAKDILKSPELMGEMTIEEWLDRLNLIKFIHIFVKNNVFTVKDIKHHCGRDGSFNEGFDFGKHDQEKMRLGLMVRGDKNAIEGFEFKTIQSCRQILQKFIKNRLIREKLLRYIREDSITGYQLQDCLKENLTYETIRDSIIARQKYNDMREKKPKDPRIIAANLDKKYMKEETEEEKKERYGYPNYDVIKLLEEFKVENPKAKLEEHQIDSEIFWEMNEGDFGAKLGIEKFGVKRRLQQRCDEIREEHRKAMEQKDKDAKKLTDEQKRNLTALGSKYFVEGHVEKEEESDEDVPLMLTRTLSIQPSLVKLKSRY